MPEPNGPPAFSGAHAVQLPGQANPRGKGRYCGPRWVTFRLMKTVEKVELTREREDSVRDAASLAEPGSWSVRCDA